MGMQIATSLAMGNAVPTAQQDPVRERRVPLPMEQNADIDRIETAPSGGRDSESMNLKQTTSENLQQGSYAFGRKLQFVLDRDSSEITVKVIDRATDKVIKVLPPEELQRLHSGMREAVGVLVDRTV